jgi:hypothetical protein
VLNNILELSQQNQYPYNLSRVGERHSQVMLGLGITHHAGIWILDRSRKGGKACTRGARFLRGTLFQNIAN